MECRQCCTWHLLAHLAQSEGQLSGASTSSSSSMSYLKAYLRRAPQPAVSLHETLPFFFYVSLFFGLRGELEAAEGGARCIRTCGSDLDSATPFAENLRAFVVQPRMAKFPEVHFP